MAFTPRRLMRGASGASTGYQISRSLRFNSADSAYLNRTPSASNRTTWTYSGWIKRSKLGVVQTIFAGNSGASDANFLQFAFPAADDSLNITGWATVWRRTTQVFRDPSAWYHIVVVWDTTQATAANRVKLYVNGSQVTAFQTSNDPTLNATSGVNANANHYISSYDASNEMYNGYMTEVNFIDGQALTPSSFGETNADTGVWQPKRYSGSYGTNGFYLNFSDNSNTTAATLGRDYSGNGNNWTPNNFSVAADVGNDSVVDVPTTSGTDTGVGGSVRGNYCTLNPLFIPLGTTYYSITNGNLTVTGTGTPNSGDVIGTISTGFTGKYYFESTVTGIDALGYVQVGASDVQQTMDALSYNYLGYLSKSYSYNSSGTKSNNNASTVYGSSFTTGDVIGVAIDCDNGAIYFSKNNTWQTSGVPTSGASKTGAAFTWTGGTQNMIPQIAVYRTGSIADNNFGQRAFVYTAPTGFKTLCTTNLPTPTIGATAATQAGKYFNTVLYTGNGTTQTISGVGFQPDFVWAKSRSDAYWHTLIDAVRTRAALLFTNRTDAEYSNSPSDKELTAFTSDGFSLGPDLNISINTSAKTFVAWNWKAGSSTVTNTSGSVNSQVSANPTAGFSIVTYTGPGGTSGTIGHGLGVAPSMIIVKNRNGITANWTVYHKSLGTLGTDRALYLNATDAETTSNSFWNNTAPTSTVFTVGNNAGTNYSVTINYVAYCFAPIAGYSAFGIYRGNGSTDGQFVHTGFKPAYVLIKRTTSGYDWWILDSARGTINAVKGRLYANAADAESTTYPYIDFLSNGFKLRDADGGLNANGEPYIYMSFASNPFKYALAR